MAAKTHSLLAPSSHEWVYCPLSAKFLATKDEEETNENAEFGTESHLLAENYIRQSLKLTDFDSLEKVDIEGLKKSLPRYDDEMERLSSDYANFVIYTADSEERRTGEKPIVLIEQELQMDYAPDTHGTLDCAVVSKDRLTIIDNKTGFIPVMAYDTEHESVNSQLGIYSYFTYRLLKDLYSFKDIRMVIFQERVKNNINEYTMTPEELTAWAKKVIYPAAEKAMLGSNEAHSGGHCKYCPGRNVCPTRYRAMMEIAKNVKMPELLSDDEIEALLPKLTPLENYIQSIREYCVKKAVEGKKWKGYTIGYTETKWKPTDEAMVVKILREHDYEPYAKPKLLSYTELRRKIGSAFEPLVGQYFVKPKGAPKLEPETESAEIPEVNKIDGKAD